MEEELLIMSKTFAEVSARNSASWVSDKIKNIKNNKNNEERLIQYEELINSLLEDKAELQRIAQSYKSMYEQITIDDEDIEYLQNTVRSTLNLLKDIALLEQNEDDFDKIVEMINKDTLKSMQLLGYNYKQAIGEPLTELTASKIRAFIK